MEVTALFYSLVGSAKLVGLDPRTYLKAMAFAAIRGEELLLPHQFVAREVDEAAQALTCRPAPMQLLAKTGQGEYRDLASCRGVRLSRFILR